MNDYKNIITKRLKDLREDNDLFQSDVAKKLGISQQYYSEYEKGKRELPIRHLYTICELYNRSADYILGFTEIEKELPKKWVSFYMILFQDYF